MAIKETSVIVAMATDTHREQATFVARDFHGETRVGNLDRQGRPTVTALTCKGAAVQRIAVKVGDGDVQDVQHGSAVKLPGGTVYVNLSQGRKVYPDGTVELLPYSVKLTPRAPRKGSPADLII